MNLAVATDLCVSFEGFRPKPYLCPAGVPTIGHGTTRYPSGAAVHLNDPPITKEAAMAYLVHDLSTRFAPGVKRMCPGLYAWSVLNDDWARFNAIVDFSYNLGLGRLQTSTLRRRIASQDWPQVQHELKRWVRGGGRVLPGLVRRRNIEAELISCGASVTR